MPNTPVYGFTYPANTAHARIWEHIQTPLLQVEALLNSWLKPTNLERTTDLAVVTATFADDAYLQVGLPESAVFDVQAHLIYSASTTGDFKVGWSCSGSGPSFQWVGNGPDSGATSGAGGRINAHATLGSTEVYGGIGTGTPLVARPAGTLKTGTGGPVFKLRWAQGTLDAVNGSTLFAGSRLTLTRIG